MKFPLFAWALLLTHLLAPSARSELRAGAAAVDITPTNLPVLVNGGMLSRTSDTVTSRLHARAIVLADQDEQVALVVVDSCMLGRVFIDEAKRLAASRTGIATNRMLVSATHTHSAPSAMACLGSEADPGYVPFLRDCLVTVIATAQRNLEPARIGWAKADAPDFTALRRWIRRPDRLAEDPFGNPTVRANMHAGRNWDDVTGESGPEDPDLTMISLRALDGRPMAVLASFSMHYFGENGLGADYFGRFCDGLAERLAPRTPPGKPPFVGLLSHGCSGDIYRVDYAVPERERPNPTIGEYTNGLLDLAVKALSGISHRDDADIAMEERRLTLNYRVPDRQRLEWAQRIFTQMGDRPATNTAEVYAREQIHLHEKQRTEVVVQALRVGDIAIATTPTETYALTGLKIKAASPLSRTMVIELANGGDGYIPPPEQHLLGGYNTWAARSAGLEVTAEPRIAETAIRLLEKVTRLPRRSWTLTDGPAARAVLSARPLAYWRLNEFAGPHAVDATGRGRDGVYEPAVAFHLEGPQSALFCENGQRNRAPHFAGGRLRSGLAGMGNRYSLSLWMWNGMPKDGRPVSGWFYSRGPDFGLGAGGDHLGVGGTDGHSGKLIYLHGDDPTATVSGNREIPRWEWQHVVLVRKNESVRVYLNGELEIETNVIDASVGANDRLFFGGRCDNDSNWDGRLDEIAVFDRALEETEIPALAHRH